MSTINNLNNMNINKDVAEFVLVVKQSLISGLGLFSESIIEKGKVIFHMFNLSQGGTYTGQIEPTNFLNHSSKNNIQGVVIKNGVYAVAKNDIYPNTELTVNYYEFEKWGLNTGIEQILKNPQHYQNVYNLNRHKLTCDKPIGHKYIF